MYTVVMVIVGALFAALLVAVLVRQSKTGLLHVQIMDLKKRMEDMRERQLETSTRNLENQQAFYRQSQQIMSDVHRKLGSLEESSRMIQEIGKDISSLQNILRAPKIRGGLGEYLLEDLLRQILPNENFEMQYGFKDGCVVDAVIRLGDGLVPIDSKFPLESFQRLVDTGAADEKSRGVYKREFIKSVKERIDEVAGKYIKPDEGTFDFAMMYIPAENVFYEIIITDNLTDKRYELFNYALERHVIPVSPNSFYSYLMAIVFGLKGFRIEQQAKTIIGELSKVQSTFSEFYGDFSVLGRHIKNASAKYDDTIRRADRFSEQVGRITGVQRRIGEDDDEKSRTSQDPLG
ncbi:MAG: DNA recombination protein RmuC [Spirochaetes bacterium]|nr:DNA recombination protein RmuC [Spirochaetota bacterium]